MSVNAIKEKIEAEAKQEAARIVKEARSQASKELAVFEKELIASRVQLLEKARSDAEAEKKRLLINAGLESREALLKARRKGIDAAFSKALSEVRALPPEDYLALMVKMVKQGGVSGGEIVMSSADRDKYGARLVEKANAAFKAGGFTLSGETRPINGGFILKSGKLEYNGSLDVIFERLQEDMESEVAEVLFK